MHPLLPQPQPLPLSALRPAALRPRAGADQPLLCPAGAPPAAAPPPAREGALRCGLHAIRAYRIALLQPALAGQTRRTWEAVRALTLDGEAPPDLLAEAARAVFALGEAEAADWLLRRARRAGSAEAALLSEELRGDDLLGPPGPAPTGSSGQIADAWADRAARAWARGDGAAARLSLRRGLEHRPHHAELRAILGVVEADMPLPEAFAAPLRRGGVSTERWRRRVGFTPTPAPGGDGWSALREDGVVHPRLARPDELAALPADHLAVRLERLIDRAVDAERFGYPSEPARAALQAMGLVLPLQATA